MLSWLEIDKKALVHNYRIFCSLTEKSKIALVLKANAYGHGLEEVYQSLASEKPDWICTNYLFEAISLRNFGFRGRILIVGPLPFAELSQHFKDALAFDCELVIGNKNQLDSWLTYTKKPKIHLKFDTGMSRQGFHPDEALNIAKFLVPHKTLAVGVCTHFANVEDVLEHEYAREQLKRFETVINHFQSQGLSPLRHAASSASCLILKESRLDLCRVGISLYGLWPSKTTRLSYLQTFGNIPELKPVLSWKASITTVKDVDAGQFIGYGCSVKALKKMRIAVLPVGYFEGYPRLAAESRSYVLIRGERCPLLGRICMNMTIVDVGHLQEVLIGDIATLLGQDGKEKITADDLASWSQTINYEIVSRINSFLPKKII